VTIPRLLNDGNTYLHLAVRMGQIEAFKTAFSEEEDKNIKNEHGQTTFHLACMHGCFEIVQVLLKNIDPEININHGRLLDLVNIFMENAAKLSFDNHGIDINAKTKLGRTAFSLACQKGHSDVVKLLIKNAVAFCIDLNIKDNSGKTAFLWACFFGHLDVVKIIMKNAANVNIDLNTKDNYDKTAFLCACQKGHTDVIKIFMENAATIDINTKDKSGSTGFHWACESGFTDLVNIFMENADKFNIDLNTIDCRGRTAFYRACAKGFSDVVEIFMDNAAALNIDLNVGAMLTKNGRVK
jgi:ankyrin repeat protein